MIPGLGTIQPVAPLGAPESRPAQEAAGAGGVSASFETMLTQAATRTIDRLEHAETLSVSALRGEADTREVIDAVMSAEQSLQAAIAIRDKVVTAYLEISRMSI